MKKNYPRNMIGYGSKTPIIKWPNGSKLALQIVLTPATLAGVIAITADEIWA